MNGVEAGILVALIVVFVLTLNSRRGGRH